MMNRYFTNRTGAIQRLMTLKHEYARSRDALTVVGMQRNGGEIQGVEQVLLSVRAGRVTSYVCSTGFEREEVFVS